MNNAKLFYADARDRDISIPTIEHFARTLLSLASAEYIAEKQRLDAEAKKTRILRFTSTGKEMEPEPDGLVIDEHPGIPADAPQTQS